ncbi:MAG TPA: TetR/AcrR family transcriptional regulator [Clostridia bacterium]|nr:TetR/AcrR family transcriptional regulator [Clostridia bacterium]
MGIREEQKQKRYWQILEAGLDLFIRKGYAATKINDIAERVGMSVGLLFHYFPSKEKLYEQLIAYGIQGSTETLAGMEMEPLLLFETITERILRYVQTDAFTAKMFVLMGQVNYNEAAPPGVRDMLREYDMISPTAKLMEKGQANGTIRDGDPYALAIAYWCSIQGIAERMALLPGTPCPQSNWIIDIIRRPKT